MARKNINCYYKLFSGSRLVSYRRADHTRRFGGLLALIRPQLSKLKNPHVYLHVSYGRMRSNFGVTEFVNEGSYDNWKDLSKAWEAFRTAN